MTLAASGDSGVAVTPHHYSTTAAIGVLRSGGNAVDAAIAANAVQGMVAPETCGIGGDLFALVHVPGSPHPEALNASGRSGSGADPERMRAAGHRTMPYRTAETITVPGCVNGWQELAARHGTRSLAELLRPAIALGEQGFETSAELASALAAYRPILGEQPSADELYPDGSSPDAGAALHRPRLATTLAAIAADGSAAFYEGPVAAAITEASGGLITAGDLAADRPDWVDPIGTDLHGMRAWTVPPNSQGYVTLATLWLIEQAGAPLDPADPALHHAVIEAYRSVAAERDELVADPDHAPLPPADLLDPERLTAHLKTLVPQRAAERPEPRPTPGGTAYLCVVDGSGMAVSLIQSNYSGIGAGVSAGGTGVWLHNRGTGFILDDGHPNELRPGKRPLHTLSPTLWTRQGAVSLLLGTRGGHQQPQYLAQAGALLMGGLEAEAVQQAPRWWSVHAPGISAIEVEPEMPADVVAGLELRGHRVSVATRRNQATGPLSIITVDGGTATGAADPRVSTATAGAV